MKLMKGAGQTYKGRVIIIKDVHADWCDPWGEAELDAGSGPEGKEADRVSDEAGAFIKKVDQEQSDYRKPQLEKLRLQSLSFIRRSCNVQRKDGGYSKWDFRQSSPRRERPRQGKAGEGSSPARRTIWNRITVALLFLTTATDPK